MDATQDPRDIEYIVDLPELLDLFGAVTDEDRRALAACRAGSFDAAAFEPAYLSTAFARAIASDSDYAIYERARAVFESLRAREVWSRTASATTVAELSRYARWMEVVAQAASAEADGKDNTDYAVESAAAQRFAYEAAKAVADLVAHNGRRGVRALACALVAGLPEKLADRVACESGHAARRAQEAVATLSNKLHGLHHVALCARIAQVGRVAS